MSIISIFRSIPTRKIISRRSHNGRICGPSYIFSLAFQHMFGDRVRLLCSKSYFDLHFKEINKTSNDKRNEDVSPVCCLQAHNANHHAKHYQYTRMAPQKAQRLDGVIKHLLHFVNGFNLHVLLIYIFHRYIIPVQFLKIHVITQKMRVMNIEKLPKNIHFRRS